MFVELEELFTKENQELEKQMSLGWNTFSCAVGEFPVVSNEPIVLKLIHKGKKRMVVQGSTRIVLGMMCDRCLTDVSVGFDIEFEKEINCNNLESEDNSDDTQYVVDMQLDVDKIIRDEILLQWPFKVLCKDDCKGICKVCGHDLNVSDCGCDRVVLDPRMAAIQDIFKNAK